MNKIKKRKELLNLSNLISNNKVIYLIDISYLNSNQITFLRKNFNDFGIRMKIVKNTLLKKTIENSKDQELNPFFPVLNGNTTILYSNKNVENIIPNIIKKFHIKEHIQKPYLKSAYVQKSFYFGNENLDILINIKSKEDLIIDVLYILQFSIRELILDLHRSSIDQIYQILKFFSYNESEKKVENKK
ncbi:50S ribosomal protein L10 [Blattabacterium cuenoti]|uniref:50S ribosomal protein L10 n=1 Tax=Blattabacterium cuenoti TaxID=1653831 RepID=UPI00163C217E|nr:50S ribosomal protein L10 [Blattabacterium cuenoti]